MSTAIPRHRLSPHRNAVLRNGTPPEHVEWRSYTIVEVYLQNLPADVKTVDIHKQLKRFGNIVQITLTEKRDSDHFREANVVFKPPPKTDLWRPPGLIDFRSEGVSNGPVRCRLSKRQRKNFTVSSPVRPGISYNEELALNARAIHFGVMRNDRSMTTFKTVSTTSVHTDGPDVTISTQFNVNLKQRQLELRFPVYLCSGSGGKLREYRFFIALDDKFTIWQTESSGGGVSYVLYVTNPPWYSRRLLDKVALSHVADGKSWREDDLWSRQTDVVHSREDFALLDRTPISIQKTGNTINLARWTTFKVDIAAGEQNATTLKVLRQALLDFNVNVKQMDDFHINDSPATAEAPYWSILPKVVGKDCPARDLLSEDKLDLPFGLRYQLEVCISQGWLSEYDISEDFVRKLRDLPEHKAVQMLVHVDSFQERVFDPMTVFTNIKFLKPVKSRQLPPNCIEVRHVTVTATGIKLYTPVVEQSNRVIRRYRASAECFLRVNFEDDDYRGQTRLYAASNNKMVLVFARVKRAMKSGIVVAGRHYDFLAWGNSQLREHGCHFFTEDKTGLTAQQIRAQMGAFETEKIVAKRAARMGQCFSTTSPIAVRIPIISQSTCIADIIKGRYTFTDGVGRISKLLAGLIQSNLKIAGQVPSCFQFRLGGCKGVLVVDPSLYGIDLKVRASQFKFDSKSQELEIIRWSEFWQPFLNRQLILVLSDLGVPTKTFMNMQKATIAALDEAMNDDNAALKALRDNVDPNHMTLNIADLVSSGFRGSQEPFVMSVLSLWRAWSLKYLKEKAKIPIKKGCFVLGVVDETATLRGHFDCLQLPQHAPQAHKEKALPDIFVQITNPQTGRRQIIEGLCILARNPSLHKGDIRVVKAVDVPALRHLCDVVVMPQTGDRDLPSMCSGGDLDGDDYVVCWDENLIPPIWNAEPFHYDAPAPKIAEGQITTDHIIDFFHDYMQNDFLGRIAHAHLGAADYHDDGVDNAQCLELVGLHSMAVDYSKTGVPAKMPRRLERTEWPHYMEKRSKSYKSYKVLGQLYDGVKREAYQLKLAGHFDPRIVNAMTPSASTKAEAVALKHEYDIALQQIMAQHKIETEFEVWSTFVLNHSKAARDFKFHEEIGQLSKTLKDHFYHSIVETCGGNTFQHLSEFAVASYQITEEEFGIAKGKAGQVETVTQIKMPFISFPWLLADVLGKIASLAGTRPTPSQAQEQVQDSWNEAGRAKTAASATRDVSPKPKPGRTVDGEGSGSKSAPKTSIRAGAAVKSSTTDPFIILDPLIGIQIAKPKNKNKSVQKVAQAVAPVPPSPVLDSRARDSSDHSLVHVHQPSSEQRMSQNAATVTPNQATAQTGFDGLPGSSTCIAPQLNPGSLCDAASASIGLNGGMMKDPAEMTVEELAALGLDDDEFL